jgi:hypothetical protein
MLGRLWPTIPALLAQTASCFGLLACSAGTARRDCTVTTRSARCGVLAGGPTETDRRQGLGREHHGVSGVAPSKVGQHGSH